MKKTNYTQSVINHTKKFKDSKYFETLYLADLQPSSTCLPMFLEIKHSSATYYHYLFHSFSLNFTTAQHSISAPHCSALPGPSQAAFPPSALILDQSVRHVWVSQS